MNVGETPAHYIILYGNTLDRVVNDDVMSEKYQQ
jgi:hypothetical protein